MRWIRTRHRDERGVAMITVILIGMVSTLLSVVAVSVTLHTFHETANGRRRVQATGSAEAGVDLAVAALSSNPYSTMPCSLNGALSTQPGQASYDTTITYYATSPPSGAALACPLGQVPASAEIHSVGSTNLRAYGHPAIDALVQLTPVLSKGLTTAIFSDQDFWPQNPLTVYGNNGNDANVYSNGNIYCAANTTVYGSIYSQGRIGGTAPDGAAGRTCYAKVDMYAKTAVDVSGPFGVGHDMSASQGNIAMSGPYVVENDATAKSTNTGGTVKGKRGSNQSGIANPPLQTLPTFTYKPVDWTGWTVGYEGSSCTDAQTAITNMGSATNKTLIVVHGTCKVSLPHGGSGAKTLLAQDLAIIAEGGIVETGELWFGSTGTQHQMMLIIPTNAVTASQPCNYTLTVPDSTGPHDIDFKGEIYALSGGLDIFMFSPCKVLLENATHNLRGQIYAQEVMLKNRTVINFVPFTVPGMTTTSSGLYTTQILYKRETGGR